MKKIISLTLIVGLLLFGGYVFFEPEIIKGESAADSITVTQAVTAEITISAPPDVALSPSIPGMTGGTSNSTDDTTWTVTTNSSTGYALTLKKNHLLRLGDGGTDRQFDDYPTATPLDFNWVAPGTGGERFGFNCVAGADVIQKYRNATDAAGNPASPCNTAGGDVSAGYCWNGIPTDPTTEEIARRTSATPAAGVATSIRFRAQAAGSNNLNSGTYTTTITATATVL